MAYFERNICQKNIFKTKYKESKQKRLKKEKEKWILGSSNYRVYVAEVYYVEEKRMVVVAVTKHVGKNRKKKK